MRAHLVGGLLAGAGLLALTACDSTQIVTPPKDTLTNGLFASYVAIGNSISAGYQSGGILDSTQQEAFPHVIAIQAGTRYAYPSLSAPGCPPPIVNFQTGARYMGGTSTTCALRGNAVAVLNNVAVPGSTANDLTAPTSVTSNALTTFILGGKTQIQRALDAKPTFVTIETGNNDWLAAALTGSLEPNDSTTSPGITPIDSVIAQYARAVNQLVAAQPKLKGLLLGVFPLEAPSALFPADSLATNALLFGEFEAAVGSSVTLVGCGSSGALVSIDIIAFLQTLPPEERIVSCIRNVPAHPFGDFFVLDQFKQDTINAAITTWNAYIQAKADSIGWAYFDPKALFDQLKGGGLIPPYPNFASATQPFGPFITLDGIHPSGLADIEIANALITTIDTYYSVSIPTATVPGS
jgi:hypothetical protein